MVGENWPHLIPARHGAKRAERHARGKISAGDGNVSRSSGHALTGSHWNRASVWRGLSGGVTRAEDYREFQICSRGAAIHPMSTYFLDSGSRTEGHPDKHNLMKRIHPSKS